MIDDSISIQQQRSRLYWQCRRGMLELDILLQGYYRKHYDSFSDDDVAVFTELLTYSDDQLNGYLMGRMVPTDVKLSALVEKIRKPSKDLGPRS